MNHNDFQKRLRRLPNEALHYIVRDCQEALDANPDTPKASDYLDQQHYCRMELAKRIRKARKAA